MKDKLKKDILEFVSKGEIAKLYMQEQKAQDLLSENELIGYYKNILDLALERLTNILESHKKISFNDIDDFATIRALYEYAMEHYHANKLNDAAALFEVIGGITNDEKFSKAMILHAKAAKNSIDLDTFLDQYADMSLVEKSGNFYIGDFTKKAQSLLEASKGEAK
jgi:predicted house-cleaning noncanonical NTP pyrophosphatase (MazG superfamily)